LQEIILGRILLVAKPAHEKLMEHSPLYSHGTKAIEQRYLRYTPFKIFLLATSKPCVHWRCSFCGLACVHFFAGPRSRAYPGALICHAALFGFSSGTVHCPRHHSAGNTHHSCLIQALRLHSEGPICALRSCSCNACKCEQTHEDEGAVDAVGAAEERESVAGGEMGSHAVEQID
jgi:hypothetical protein